MISRPLLLSDLQRLLDRLEDDLRQRSIDDPAIQARLTAQHTAARAAKRTAAAYPVWRDELVTQVGVAWILGCVFVRFLEDNDLLDSAFFSGPGERRRGAEQQHDDYFRAHPVHSDRDYLEHVFRTVRALPTLDALFDEQHNPIWQFGPSGDAATELLRFWQTIDPETGTLRHDFTDPDWDTRFLGDLYQDLSESARKKYALLQTPQFVEEFILDRTLTPAIDTFGLEVVRMIDPTCGSGHFVLGGFDRILELWRRREPGTPIRELVQRTLNALHGVDLNPFAVAIARFRLLIAALRACEVQRLRHSPAFRFHLAVGDSLLFGPKPGEVQSHAVARLEAEATNAAYQVEDIETLLPILGQKYHAVVGNPPYITVKDKALNQAYRDRFGSCHRKYSLAVPFMERFFDLAVQGDGTAQHPAGCVGMITANSFMKREFGSELIEEFIPRWDLTHVIDTSGAYIPGHGTPTVILFGKNQPPVAPVIRAVMGIRGEPSTPEDPARGKVWTAIVTQVDQPGSQSEFVSVADTARESFHKHPWSIGGGGAAELKELLDSVPAQLLGNVAASIGIGVVTLEDEAFCDVARTARIRGLCPDEVVSFVEGDAVREWTLDHPVGALFPYPNWSTNASLSPEALRALWPLRVNLSHRTWFRQTQVARGLSWFEYGHVSWDKFATPVTITFGEVATHNHFVLDRGGKVFNRTAPVIKLPAGASEDDHLGLLGLLNSSTGCFWLKQVCFPKGGDHQGNEGARVRTTLWDERYAFNSTQVGGLPVPARRPLETANGLDRCAVELGATSPTALLASAANHTGPALNAAAQRWTETLQRMIALQEELDWECYRLYQLASEQYSVFSVQTNALKTGSLITDPLITDHLPPLKLGERAFEIVMARRMAAGELETEWFARHGSQPITELPAHWPPAYRALVERRIALIESDRNIGLIEQPEYKRRWNVEPWDAQLERALREWLLNRLETYFYGGERMVVAATQKCAAISSADSAQPVPEGSTESPTPTPAEASGGIPTADAPDPVAALRSSWPGGQQPALVSTHRLADCARGDADFLRVAELYRGRPDFDLPALVAELVEDEAVPFLPIQRYKESGLRNRAVWEETWALQRREDDIESQVRSQNAEGRSEAQITAEIKRRQQSEVGEIPVPPKYKSADFRPGPSWRLRGKLDVPKERWISYPGCERDAGGGLIIAWAGWDHLQQAQALAAWYEDLRQSGASDAKLLLVLAGLQQLIPWLLQWHNDLNPDFGVRMGEYFRDYAAQEARRLGKTEDDLQSTAY